MPVTRSTAELLQATLELVADSGIDALTLSQVATRAGVSRATAYREFGDKDGLLAALAQSEIAAMVTHTLRGIDRGAPPSTAIPGIVRAALTYLRGHQAFTYLRTHEPHWLLQAVIVVGDDRLNLVQTVATAVASTFSDDDSASLRLPPIQAAEVVVRTVLSHTLMDQSTLTDHQVAETVTRAITR